MKAIVILCVSVYFFWKLPLVRAKSGPFKSLYKRVGPCASPPQPMDSEPAALFHVELYNTSTDFNIMKGNITVLKEHRLHKMKGKCYIWENSKWKLNFLINNMGCKSVFFPVLAMATRVKYDAKTCTFYKGVYLFDGFDVNKVQHLWMNSQEYGKILWRIEYFSRTGTVFCYDFEMLVEKSK